MLARARVGAPVLLGALAVFACGRFGADTDPDAVAPADAGPATKDATKPQAIADAGNDQATAATCADGGPACAAWEACEGTCVSVAAELDGLRYEVPCTNDDHPACLVETAHPPDKTVTLAGTVGQTYDLVVRIRGVIEQHTFDGDSPGPATGTNAEFFTQGGSSDEQDTWNIYDLRVSKPASTWHLNSGMSGKFHSDLVDYRATIRAEANATLTVHSDSGDASQANNQGVDGSTDPLMVPGMSVFHGQFLQLDLVSVTPAPRR